MAQLRAVVTLPWTSGLPEDISVNTFHFLTTSSPASAGELAEIVTDLTAFYNSDFGAAGDPLGSYISSLVSRAANACSIEIFDLGDPEPRQPVNVSQFQLVTQGTTNNLPTEVAKCASFQAAPVSGIPQARRRGRVYIGPLNYNAAVPTTARPATAFIQAIEDSCVNLLALLVGSGVVWTVYSRVGNAMSAVTNGWVDNEWDTQRSRGQQVTVRNTW